MDGLSEACYCHALPLTLAYAGGAQVLKVERRTKLVILS